MAKRKNPPAEFSAEPFEGVVMLKEGFYANPEVKRFHLPAQAG